MSVIKMSCKKLHWCFCCLTSIGQLPYCLQALVYRGPAHDLHIQILFWRPYLYITTVQSLTMIPDQYPSQSCLRGPTSCHLRIINTSLSIMHAGGRISNMWLDNKFIPSIRERSFFWPSGYLLFFRNELHGIFCWEGKMMRTKGIS